MKLQRTTRQNRLHKTHRRSDSGYGSTFAILTWVSSSPHHVNTNPRTLRSLTEVSPMPRSPNGDVDLDASLAHSPIEYANDEEISESKNN